MVAVQLTADQFTEVKDEEVFDPVVDADPFLLSFEQACLPHHFKLFETVA